MKILYTAAEISPFAKMTNTADMLRFLPASLQDAGFEIRILLPKYGHINDRRNRLHEVIRLSGIEVDVAGSVEKMKIKVASIPNAKLQVYFLDNKTYFKRKGIFNNPENGNFFKDNDKRVVFYTKAVIETIKKLGWEPQIIHCHDWPSGLIPFIVKKFYHNEDLLKNTKVIFNIHHAENQGQFSGSLFEHIGLADDVDISQELDEEGNIDLLKMGIKYADHVVTGNEITKQYDELFEQMGVTPTPIQGAPQDVSNKFSNFYREIATEE
jgi:starch synthase